MQFQNISLTTENFISTLVISRPAALNALNKDTLEELSTAMDFLKTDSNTKVILITGEGEKSFVAGADIKEFLTLDAKTGTELSQKGHQSVFDKIENSPKPTIALINGFALGGGLELALSCHIRLASKNAKLGLPEVTLGLIPGYGGTQRLAQIIGKGRAMQAIFTAEFFSAERAFQIGLVNDLAETPAELLEMGKTLAQKIIGNSSTAISAAIEAINLYNQPEKGYQKEISAFGTLFSTHDFKEGTTAFVEKRKPKFE